MNTASATDRPAKSSPFVYVLVALGVLAVLGGALTIVLRLFFFVPYQIPASSMLPTLPPGTRVWANPSIEAPFPRGAVVVFRYPEKPSQSFAKRVAGVTGDTIETKRGRLSINGWEVPRCPVGTWSYTDEGDAMQHTGELVVEYFDTSTYLIFEEASASPPDYQGPYYVAAGQYFVLGDNRNNSHDSRMWFGGTGGGVPFDHSQGRVRNVDAPKLPPGAERLQANFDACLAKPPARTSAPPGKP